MQDCVKCCREVHNNEDSYVFSVKDHEDVVFGSDEWVFSTVVGPEYGLRGIEELVVSKVVGEALVD